MDARGGTSRSLEGSIAEMRAAFVVALTEGDAASASEAYADDAKLLAPAAELLQGREAIETFWRAGIEAGIEDVELESLELARSDDLAYEIGRYTLRLRPSDDAVVVDRGKYLLVHARQSDGAWRRAVEMFNPDAPPDGHPRERRDP